MKNRSKKSRVMSLVVKSGVRAGLSASAPVVAATGLASGKRMWGG